MKPGCFLFLGPELGEKQAALNELRKKITAGGDASRVEETVYYAGEVPANDIVAALRNGSLFADARIFLVKNAENFKKKDEIDLLTAYMVSPQSDTTLVLISEENNISKSFEKPAGVEKRTFYELSEQKKVDWVNTFFRKEGFRLNSDAVLTILELVENNTEALKRECSRLVLFLPKDREVDPAEIEKWLSHTREESAFTLFSRVAAGDFSRGMESLRTLLAAKTEPQAIFAGLLWCFRKLRDYVALAEAGTTSDFELRKIGIIAPQARRDYSNAARLYDSAGVETCISLAAEYDLKTRSANTFPKSILMDEFLYKIHFEARSAGRR